MSAAKSGLLSEIYPEILKAKTDFIKGSNLNIEALMALKPDVVFVNSGDKKMIEQIENAGIPAVAVSASKWDYDVLKTYDEWLALLGEVFPDHAKTDAAAAYSRQVAKTIADRTAKLTDAEKKKVLFVFQYDAKRLVTSGKHFFGQYWCNAVGAKRRRKRTGGQPERPDFDGTSLQVESGHRARHELHAGTPYGHLRQQI